MVWIFFFYFPWHEEPLLPKLTGSPCVHSLGHYLKIKWCFSISLDVHGENKTKTLNYTITSLADIMLSRKNLVGSIRYLELCSCMFGWIKRYYYTNIPGLLPSSCGLYKPPKLLRGQEFQEQAVVRCLGGGGGERGLQKGWKERKPLFLWFW